MFLSGACNSDNLKISVPCCLLVKVAFLSLSHENQDLESSSRSYGSLHIVHGIETIGWYCQQAFKKKKNKEIKLQYRFSLEISFCSWFMVDDHMKKIIKSKPGCL